jgi:hypothetical protein
MARFLSIAKLRLENIAEIEKTSVMKKV